MKPEEIKQYKQKLELKEIDDEPVGAYLGAYKKIHCPSCHDEVPVDNINLNDKIGKCSSCNVVFSLQPGIKSLLDSQKIEQEVIRPEGIDIFRYKDDLEISVQQPMTVFEGVAIPLLFLFTLIFTMAFFKGKIDIWLPAIIWGVNIAMLSRLIYRSRHKIYIDIDDEELTIKWRPKNFMRDKRYDIDQIDQLYVQQGGAGISLNMIVNGVDGQKHVKLINSLTSLPKAKYLEQEIEHHIGIVNRPVHGEIK